MLGNYHDLYVTTNVALLADVFENFRDICMEKYGLDPAHYYTLPGLLWDALLKKNEDRARAFDRHRYAPFRQKGKPELKSFNPFTNSLAGIHMQRTSIFLNKPLYMGMTILDNSKILMYDFYYNTLKKRYGNKCELLYTDTDSLLLEIETKTFMKT